MELIFVYNAKTGIFNKVSDFAHKIISPDTYECSLCQISYGNFGIKQKWNEFLNSVPFKKTFVYKNETAILDNFKIPKTQFPSIWIKSDITGVQPLMEKTELESYEQLEDLIEELKKRLKV